MIKKILKYLARTITYTLLVILITFGLALLFVFVTSKIAKSQDKEPPINLFTIISPSMTPNINVYDVVVAVKTSPSKIKVGDVISFYSDNPNVNGMTITHRVVQVYQDYQTFSFKTKGDFNKDMDPEFVVQDKIVGKVYFKIPQLGRIQFFLGSKGGWLIAILIPALAIISYDIYKIIKLIIVKQKILSYKDGDNATKAEISNEPIISEIVNEENLVNPIVGVTPLEIVQPEVLVNTEKKYEAGDSSQMILQDVLPLPEQEVQQFGKPQIVSEQVNNTELPEIKVSEETESISTYKPEEIKLEETGNAFQEEKIEEQEISSEEKPDEIIVISD